MESPGFGFFGTRGLRLDKNIKLIVKKSGYYKVTVQSEDRGQNRVPLVQCDIHESSVPGCV